MRAPGDDRCAPGSVAGVPSCVALTARVCFELTPNLSVKAGLSGHCGRVAAPNHPPSHAVPGLLLSLRLPCAPAFPARRAGGRSTTARASETCGGDPGCRMAGAALAPGAATDAGAMSRCPGPRQAWGLGRRPASVFGSRSFLGALGIAGTAVLKTPAEVGLGVPRWAGGPHVFGAPSAQGESPRVLPTPWRGAWRGLLGARPRRCLWAAPSVVAQVLRFGGPRLSPLSLRLLRRRPGFRPGGAFPLTADALRPISPILPLRICPGRGRGAGVPFKGFLSLRRRLLDLGPGKRALWARRRADAVPPRPRSPGSGWGVGVAASRRAPRLPRSRACPSPGCASRGSARA